MSDKPEIEYSMRATTTVDGRMLTAHVVLTREFIEDAAVNVAKYAADRLDEILRREADKARGNPGFPVEWCESHDV